MKMRSLVDDRRYTDIADRTEAMVVLAAFAGIATRESVYSKSIS
jgi:hypothetical protein